MKGELSKDLVLTFLLALIITIVTSTALITNYALYVLFFILIFLFSGYASISVLYPEETFRGLFRKPILIMELSVFLTVLISVILKYSSLGLQLRDLTLILSLITIVLLFAAYILRIKNNKPVLEEKPAPENPETTTPKLSLLKQKLPKNLITFTLLSLLMIITILVPALNKTDLWMVLGSLFVCLIPGYLLLAVMFPKNEDMELIERLALAFGGSIILTSLIGLAFYYTPWKIRIEYMLIVLAVFSLIFCLITFLRMRKVPLERRLSIPKLEKIISIFLIISILLTIATATYGTFLKPPDTKTNSSKNFTTFNIKEVINTTNYTLNLTSGKKTNLTLVLLNMEGSTVNYRLVVKVNNTTLKQDNLTLQNSQKMEIPFNFTAGTPGQKKMEFLLYKLPDENPYQIRSFWIKIT